MLFAGDLSGMCVQSIAPMTIGNPAPLKACLLSVTFCRVVGNVMVLSASLHSALVMTRLTLA